MNTISSILSAAASLSVEQQLALNKGLCELIKRNRRAQAAVAGAQFVPGDVVRFNTKTRGIKHIVINGFNRAGTAVVGYECYPNGQLMSGGLRWTVSNNICTKVV